MTLGTYDAKSTGGGVRCGLPITEDDFVNFGLSVDRHDPEAGFAQSAADMPGLRDDSSARRRPPLLSSAGWAQDTIDSRIYPTKGSSFGVGGELGLPGGNVKYCTPERPGTRTTSRLTKDQTLMLNGELGDANGYGGQALPFFKNFYAGGIGSVRGYDTSSLGPIDPSTGEPTGRHDAW